MACDFLLPIDTRYFDRWLALFAETVHDVRQPAAGERFDLFFRRIAESFALSLANSQGVMQRKGGRYSAASRQVDGTGRTNESEVFADAGATV